MKGFAKKIKKLFVAIAFAEAGEFDTAREYMREEDRTRQIDRVIPSVRPRQELRAPGLRGK
jgi:hypothetical protein